MRLVQIPGIDGAFVNEAGEVYRNGKRKKASLLAVGYYAVVFSVKNKSHTRYIHRMLAELFIGCPPTPKHEVCHINGVRTDNRIENLRWGTHKENMGDAIAHGTATIGHKNGAAKLTASDVAFIGDMKKMGFYAREIAPHFNVSITTINRLTSGQTYKELSL